MWFWKRKEASPSHHKRILELEEGLERVESSQERLSAAFEDLRDAMRAWRARQGKALREANGAINETPSEQGEESYGALLRKARSTYLR